MKITHEIIKEYLSDREYYESIKGCHSGVKGSGYSGKIAAKLKCSTRLVAVTVTGWKKGRVAYPERPKNAGRQPRILLYDLETMPLVVYAWQLKKHYTPPDFVIKPVSLACWSAKWLYEPEVFGDVVTPNQAFNRQDKKVCQSLWSLIDQADILVGHNARQFDNRVANTRFKLNNLNPPSFYRTIDTLLISRANFMFASNTLNYLSKILLHKEKLKTSFDLWKRCDSKGEVAKEALDYMFKYNKQDVLLLEDDYAELIPWAKSGINLGAYYDDIKDRCPRCGSKKLVVDKKKYVTNRGRYQSMRCEECGAIGHGNRTELSAKDKKNLSVPVPKFA